MEQILLIKELSHLLGEEMEEMVSVDQMLEIQERHQVAEVGVQEGKELIQPYSLVEWEGMVKFGFLTLP
jgi:hypothetical protein